jgi:predicted metal-dependent phosphoesterase TrpH
MKADLHVHTSYSFDSTSPPQAMIDSAIKKGIDCLAICDHGEIRGSLEAIEYAKEKPVLIIPGIEVKAKEGDILGLNVKEIIPNKLSTRETIKRIKEAGGMAVIPHPFGWCCSFKGKLVDLIEEIDGLEIFNASIFGPGNQKASDFAGKHDLPFTASSDAHSPDFVGRAYLEIPGENLSIEEILQEIKRKNCKVRSEKVNSFEKIFDHVKRNVAKLKILNMKN